ILIYGGVPLQSGFYTALILLAELLYMVTIFIRNHQVKLYSKLTVLVAFVILSCPAFGSDADLYNEALPLMTAFRFLSGWAGIAVLIISPILIAAAGEIYLKNKKDPSWHLK
ncbi:MAG: hypothetical protein K2H90_02075, partial [Oscillospiraceae bacterium]|nr:hypothetical protein [Oscillospiraceae bacterium]